MASPARIAANRKDARRSTGPRTASGKACSALNRLTHGLCSATVTIPGEDPSEWDQFRDRIVGSLSPANPLEEELAHRVAVCLWRVRRCGALEATGGGFGTRELYSDDEETTFNATRPVMLNGIEDIVTRPDLLERSLLIYHPTIPEERRRPEAELWAEFEECYSDLLGAVLDYVAGGLRELPNVRLDRLPRMADFARFAVACEAARPENDRLFLTAYHENQAGANEQVLDESLVAVAVKQFMASHAEWRGTATELLELLKGLVPEDQRKDKDQGWPKLGNGLSNKLKRLAPSLRRATQIDICIGEKGPDRKRTRLITIRRLTDNSPDGSSTPSAPGDASHPPPVDADSLGNVDRPRTVLPSSDVAAESPQKSRRSDGADDADDPSRSSLDRPSDPPVTPAGKRRRGRA